MNNDSSFPVIETTVRVRYAETDQSGIVYNANYLIWCELGRGEYFWQRGRDYGRDIEAHGFSLPVVEAHLRYLAPARYGDLVTIKTTIESFKSRELTFSYAIRNEQTGQVLCIGWTRHMWVDRKGQVRTAPAEAKTILF
jgi:acyl-CoA thioester hydrolase